MHIASPSRPGATCAPDGPCLFALEGSREWGEAVARCLDRALAPHEEREFEDGEHKSRPLASVRGRDVYLLHSLYGDAHRSVNDKLCRLLFLVGALKDASAASVTAVVPYLAYARKDRRSKARDPVTTRYVAALLESVGMDRIVTLEVHNPAAYQNAFRRPAEHLEMHGLMAAHFAQLVGPRDAVVVAPDAGGIHRADAFRQRLATLLGRPVGSAFAEKHRSEGVVSGDLFVGDVAGRVAIVVDDLIGSGTTLARTAAACRRRGAEAVHAGAAHGLFTGDAARVLADDALAGITVTDSVPPLRLPPGPARDKLTVLPTAPLFAEAIRRMHAGGSLTDLLQA